MKLNLAQWGPETKVSVPGFDQFFFTHDLEKNLQEHFRDLKDCAIGIASEKELFKWQSYKWEPLHFVDHFDKNPEAREKLRLCGCHVRDDGRIGFRHYVICFAPKWVVKGREELRRKQRESQIQGEIAQKASDISRELGSEVEANVEIAKETIEVVPVAEGSGRGRRKEL